MKGRAFARPFFCLSLLREDGEAVIFFGIVEHGEGLLEGMEAG